MASPFPRRTALAVLALLGILFGANHIAARIAFDHGTGVMTAMLTRSGLTALALLGVVLWLRKREPALGSLPLRPPPGSVPWLLVLGTLITLQGTLLFAAVVRIPVALALLLFNAYAVLYALLTWALGGKAPGARAGGLMALILLGLALALDVPGKLQGGTTPGFAIGVASGLGAAVVFSFALWVTERRLHAVNGPLRSLLTMVQVFVLIALASASGLLGGAMQWPADGMGWLGLGLLTLLYGTAFSLLFVLMPRLDMASNAPALNIEPIAALGMGWLILDQTLSMPQVVGALIVVGGIVLLSRLRIS